MGGSGLSYRQSSFFRGWVRRMNCCRLLENVSVSVGARQCCHRRRWKMPQHVLDDCQRRCRHTGNGLTRWRKSIAGRQKRRQWNSEKWIWSSVRYCTVYAVCKTCWHNLHFMYIRMLSAFSVSDYILLAFKFFLLLKFYFGFKFYLLFVIC